MTAAKICIVGAGAIGGYLAVRLARAGNQVSVIARGAQLAAIRARGLTLIDADGGRETAAGLAATDALSDLGQQDNHKTSMLQDVEAGRAIEIDALLGSVIELGKITYTPTPHLDAVYARVKLLSHATLERNACVRALEVQGIVAPIVPEAGPAPDFTPALGAAA